MDVGKLRTVLNVGPVVAYPEGSAVLYRPSDLDIHSADDLKRRVLLSDPLGSATDEDILLAFPLISAKKHLQLLSACIAYEYSEINGSALAMLTSGVLQGLPLSMSIKAWLKTLWDEFYRRKSLVNVQEEPDLDFSAFGPMPCTIPELMQELGV